MYEEIKTYFDNNDLEKFNIFLKKNIDKINDENYFLKAIIKNDFSLAKAMLNSEVNLYRELDGFNCLHFLASKIIEEKNQNSLKKITDLFNSVMKIDDDSIGLINTVDANNITPKQLLIVNDKLSLIDVKLINKNKLKSNSEITFWSCFSNILFKSDSSKTKENYQMINNKKNL